MRLIDADVLWQAMMSVRVFHANTSREESLLRRCEQLVDNAPTVEAKPVDEIHKLSESEFITFILSTICDYAKTNDYEITDTVKTMGENLVALTEICTFDNWKAGADMRGGKNE